MFARAAASLQEKIDGLSPRGWRNAALATIAVALLVRLVVIAATGGGFNLRIFRYFGQLAADGANPYDAPVGGEFDPKYGDNPPLEMLLFAGLLKVHQSADTLRVFFALGDAAVMALTAFAYPRSRAFRANFLVFYGFNPLLLEAWTGFADDKALLLGLTIAVLIGVETGRLVVSWSAAASLAALKWFSVLFAPALAVHSAREGRSWRWLALACLGFIAVLALSQLPWFPDSLDAFARRSDRIAIDPPIHAAPTQLLDQAGVYSPLIPRLFAPISLAAVYVLFLLRRIDISDTVVLSVFCAYVALPDEGFNRMLQIALPFLFVVAMTARRWLALWATSVLAAAAVLVEFRDFSVEPIEALFGAYGSLRHVLFVNLVLALVFAFYVRDRLLTSGSVTGPAEFSAGQP